jgi:phospholipase C
MADTKVEHVFVLMLENHSFDSVFAMSGIPGITCASTANSNTAGGETYHVRDGAPVNLTTDPGHEFWDVYEQLTGTRTSQFPGDPYTRINNSGFASNYAWTTTEGRVPVAADIADVMACFTTKIQLPVIYQLATRFAVCDRWFSSMPGPTWPNRYFVHGASSAGLDHSPTAEEIVEWSTAEGFVYPNGSVFDALTKAGMTWRLYNDTANSFAVPPAAGGGAGALPQVVSLKNIHAWNVRDVGDLAADLNNGYDCQYTFIEPNYGDVIGNTFRGGSSQHPMDDPTGGENLIAAVYDAVRNSPIWDKSLLIVTYDEHGGLYDSVAPPAAAPPNDNSPATLNQSGFKFDRLGLRVPAVVISPWIPAGTVVHDVFDHSSIYATLRTVFPALAPLTDRDKAANNVRGLLSLSAPRDDCPVSVAREAFPIGPPTAAIAPEAAIAPTAPAQASAPARDSAPIPDKGPTRGTLGNLLKADLALATNDAEREAAIQRHASLTTVGDARAYAASVMAKVAAAKANPR